MSNGAELQVILPVVNATLPYLLRVQSAPSVQRSATEARGRPRNLPQLLPQLRSRRLHLQRSPPALRRRLHPPRTAQNLPPHRQHHLLSPFTRHRPQSRLGSRGAFGIWLLFVIAASLSFRSVLVIPSEAEETAVARLTSGLRTLHPARLSCPLNSMPLSPPPLLPPGNFQTVTKVDTSLSTLF